MDPSTHERSREPRASTGTRILVALMIIVAAVWSAAWLHPLYRYLSPPHERGLLQSGNTRGRGAGIDDSAGPSPCSLHVSPD
jgi:hypothetical protein